jgi:drug/metabolite transporter (DMT)-like permease
MPRMDRSRGGQGAGIAAMAGCAFLWSLAGLFIKAIDWNPFAIACGRSLVAGLFLLAWIRRPRLTFSKAQVGAALSNAATMLLFVYANKTTTSANAILLQYGAPIYVAVIGFFVLKERPRIEQVLAFLALAVGLALFFLEGVGGGRLAGDIAAAVSGLTFALHFVFMRMQKDGSPIESSLLAHLVTALVALPLSLLYEPPTFTALSVAAVAVLGIVQIGIASILFAYGIKRVSAVQSVLVGVIEPVFNPVWVFLAVGEAPGLNALAGGCVIVAAVTISSVVTLRRGRRNSGAAGSLTSS